MPHKVVEKFIRQGHNKGQKDFGPNDIGLQQIFGFQKQGKILPEQFFRFLSHF